MISNHVCAKTPGYPRGWLIPGLTKWANAPQLPGVGWAQVESTDALLGQQRFPEPFLFTQPKTVSWLNITSRAQRGWTPYLSEEWINSSSISPVSKTVRREEYTTCRSYHRDHTYFVSWVLLTLFNRWTMIKQQISPSTNQFRKQSDKPYTNFAQFPYICSLMQLATWVFCIYLTFWVSP